MIATRRRPGRCSHVRIALSLLMLAVLAAPAGAAEVRWQDGPGRFGGPYVDVTAAAGEANEVTVEAEPSGRLVVTDSRNDLSAVAPCRSEAPRRVSCPFPGTISVDLGDGADTLATTTDVRGSLGEGDDVATSALGSIHGGPGNDRLTTNAVGVMLHGDEGDDLMAGRSLLGGPGADTLLGTGGGDYILGGPGDDRIAGGEGDDLLGAGEGVAPLGMAGEPGVDQVDGGAGSDVVFYDDALAGVTFDLRAPAPEGDTLQSIENVGGSRFDDRLLGSDAGERLSSDAGRDFIDGRGGGDVIGGGGGPDNVAGGDGDDVITAPGGSVVDAGPGDDRLTLFTRYGAGPRAPASLDCGPGRDVVMEPLWAFAVPASCERIGLGEARRGIFTTARPTRTVVPLVCHERASCEIDVEWRRESSVLDRRNVSLRSGRRARVRSRAASRATAVRIVVRPKGRRHLIYGLRF